MAPKLLPRDVRKAVALLEADPSRDRDIADLAAACGVAPRTLQKHFKQFLGKTPVAVLREARLELVRRELLGGGASLSITALATRAGFSHLGRFAGWYRDRYGESPSTTLARSRARAAGPTVSTILPVAPDRPAIAILPFDLHVEPARHFAGIAEDLALALARLRWLAVAAPGHARYHVRGSVRAGAAGTLRITVVLRDAATGRHLWADAWSGEAGDTPAFEERVAHAIVGKLQAALRGAEIDRACRREPEQATPWELTLRSLSRAVRLEPLALGEALELAERAIELSPEDPLPIAVAAWCRGMRAGHNFTRQPVQERAAAHVLADRAGRLRARDPIAESLLAAAYTLAHDLERASVHVERALTLDGSCAWAWQRGGWINVYRGEAAEAIERFQIARHLDPEDPLTFLSSIGIAAANFERARYPEAARWFRRGMLESPTAVWAHRFLAPSHALCGDRDAARASLTTLMAVYPDWTITQVRAALPHTPSFVDRAATGLESLGMPL